MASTSFQNPFLVSLYQFSNSISHRLSLSIYTNRFRYGRTKFRLCFIIYINCIILLLFLSGNSFSCSYILNIKCMSLNCQQLKKKISKNFQKRFLKFLNRIGFKTVKLKLFQNIRTSYELQEFFGIEKVVNILHILWSLFIAFSKTFSKISK